MTYFRKSPGAIRSMDEWIGRADAVDGLRNCVATRENTVLMGVEGSGKSSLLKSYFSFSYRKEMAAKQKKLMIFVDMSNAADRSELSDYLFEELHSGARKLLTGDDREEVMAELDYIRSQSQFKPKERYEAAVQSLGEMDYYVVLLMDHFENFTSSLKVTKAHHDMLRSLIEKDLLQCIVATNYDLNKDSLPEDVGGSLYLQKFQNQIDVRPFTLAEATAFVREKLKDSLIQFNEKQIQWIHTQTGGIPSLFELGCSLVYDYIASHGKLRPKEVEPVLQEKALATLERWCKMYSPSHMKALKQLLAVCEKAPELLCPANYNDADKETLGAAKALKDRWILTQHYRMDENKQPVLDDEGNPVPMQNVFQFNSKLLQWYLLNNECKESELLAEKRRREEEEQAKRKEAEKRDQARAEKEAHEAAMRQLEQEKLQKQIANLDKHQPENVTNVTNIYEGAYTDNRGATMNTVNQVVNVPTVSAEQFLEMLNFGKITEQYKLRLEGKARTIQSRLAALPALPQTPDGISAQNRILDVETVKEVQLDKEDIAWLEQEQELEQEISKIANEVIPDVDPESLEDANLDDFEKHFRSVRKDLDLEEQLSDQILDSLSPQCCFYVKAAVIVEEHMNAIEALLGGDCSTHLVMYGKCLEQSLRDTLFHLFRDNEEFRFYNTRQRKYTNDLDRETFGGMNSETDAMLGNFTNMLYQKKGDLGQLCEKADLVVEGINNGNRDKGWWTRWWGAMANSLNRARVIRNQVHAGDAKPVKLDLQKLRKEAFGLEGILFRSQVARELNLRLHQPEQKRLTEAQLRDLKGTVQTLNNVTVGSKGVLDGAMVLEDCPVKGHMSAKVARSLGADPADLAGQSIQVRLSQYDKQNDWFVVEPV